MCAPRALSPHTQTMSCARLGCCRYASTVRAFQSCTHACCAYLALSWATERLCCARQGAFVARIVCQLCHDSTIPCHDTNSMSRPKLSCDLERQVATWEPYTLSKSIAIENSLLRQNFSVVCVWPVLSCTHGLFFFVASSVAT